MAGSNGATATESEPSNGEINFSWQAYPYPSACINRIYCVSPTFPLVTISVFIPYVLSG